MKNTIKLTKKLVSIPSYVDRDTDESDIALFIYKYIKSNIKNFKITKQKVDKKRFNILAKGKKDPKLIFVCHLDTVKPQGEESRSIAPRIKENKLYGLGALDMKGGIAATLLSLKNADCLDRTAVIFDCDEEYYFKGIKEILKEYSFNPKLVVCPEPTDLKIINGCRGITEIRFDCLGRTGHAANPSIGKNAIEISVKLVQELRKELNRRSLKDLGKTTINLSSLTGGRLLEENIVTQANAIPDIARVLLDIRTACPSLNSESIKNKLMKISSALGARINNLIVNIDYKPYFTNREDICLFCKALKVSNQQIAFAEDLSKRGFYEASLISNRWECPAISFGPSPSDMAHKKNEYVDTKSLERTESVFTSLINLFS